MSSGNEIQRIFNNTFPEKLTEVASDLETSLFALIRAANAFVVRDPDEQERFYAESGDINEFLSSDVINMVRFRQNRLLEWAREASKFSSLNYSHDNFDTLFADRLQYVSVIESASIYDFSMSRLANFVRNTYSIKGILVADRFPVDFREVIKFAVQEAIRRSLVVVANDVKTSLLEKEDRVFHRLRHVQREPSFRDVKGAVGFTLDNGKLKLGSSPIESKRHDYLPLINRAVLILTDSGNLQRLHNRDPILSNLFTEYRDELANQGGNAVTLTIVGLDISKRIELHEKGHLEESLDDGELYYINSFLTAHNLYIQSFEDNQQIIGDLERAASLYKRVEVRYSRVPWKILEEISTNGDIVESASGKAMRKAAINLQDDQSRRGLVAIGLGLLRGSLRTLALSVMNVAVKIVEKTMTNMGSLALIDALKAVGVYEPILNFFQNNAELLVRLSGTIPIYFSWVKNLLQVLKISG